MPKQNINLKKIIEGIREEMISLEKVFEGGIAKAEENAGRILALSRRCGDAFYTFLDERKIDWETQWVRSLAYFYAKIYKQITGIPEYPRLSYSNWEEKQMKE